MMPLYATVLHDLMARIERGEFRPDQPIPTEQELCGLYGVSRITVRRAVERLVATRVIYRRRGIGTFIQRPDPRGKSLRLVGRIEDILTFDQKLGIRVLKRGMQIPPPPIRHAFNTSDRARLYGITAINFLDGKPYSVTRSFFAPELAEYGPRIRVSDGQTAIRSIQDITDLRVKFGEQTIEPAIARGEMARHLGIKTGTAVIATTRSYFSAPGRPIEAVHVHYHPERYHFRVELLMTDSFDV